MIEELELEWSEGTWPAPEDFDGLREALDALGVVITGERGDRYALMVWHADYELDISSRGEPQIGRLSLSAHPPGGCEVVLDQPSSWRQLGLDEPTARRFAGLLGGFLTRHYEVFEQRLRRALKQDSG